MDFTGTLYYKLGIEHPPEWTKLVNPNLKKAVEFPSSQSASAVLFIHTQRGFYAYTFGVGGRRLLKREALVPDFGKKTVLSIADPNQLRSIDLRAMREQPFLTRQQPSRGTRLRAFGIDTLQDHLRAVTGVPYGKYEKLAKQVAGADALAYRAPMEFSDLGAKSDEFLAAFVSEAYKQIRDFSWVDQVSLVRSQVRIGELDSLMLDRVKTKEFEFSPPDMIDWNRSPTFAFQVNTVLSQRLDFLSTSSLLDVLGAELNAVSIDRLKTLSVHCFYDDSDEPEFTRRAYDCIEVDLVDGGEQFAFAAGSWSAISANFQQTVNLYVEDLKQHAPAFPAARLIEDSNKDGTHVDETKYIKRLTDSNPNAMAKIHGSKHKVYVGDVEVELCDIYNVCKDFIHLKIWRGSQGFSALAMQAANSAELLLSDKQFLSDCRALVEGMGNQYSGVLPDAFNPRDYRIVFGLIRKEGGDIPFFSRLTLMRAAERIVGKALRASFAIIPVQ